MLQERGYAFKDNNQQFEPTTMGEALIGAYDRMGLKAVYECAFMQCKQHPAYPSDMSCVLYGFCTLQAQLAVSHLAV